MHQLQDVGEHDVWSVESPDEVQMFPVLDVLMEDQLRDLGTENQLPVSSGHQNPVLVLRSVLLWFCWLEARWWTHLCDEDFHVFKVCQRVLTP